MFSFLCFSFLNTFRIMRTSVGLAPNTLDNLILGHFSICQNTSPEDGMVSSSLLI
jgi:hypothetical protein